VRLTNGIEVTTYIPASATNLLVHFASAHSRRAASRTCRRASISSYAARSTRSRRGADAGTSEVRRERTEEGLGL
jgi:hypothetical protein